MKFRYIYLLSFVLILLSGVTVFSQEIRVDTDRGIMSRGMKKDLNGDVIIAVEYIEEGWFFKGGLIKVTPELDTTILIIDDTLNKVTIYDLLITQNNNYIVSACERIVGDTCYGIYNRYSFFVYDEDFNLLSFRRYMSPVSCERPMMKLTQRDDGRIFGMSLNPGFLFMIEINEQGDTLKTFFEQNYNVQGTRTKLLKSNKESVAFYGFMDKFTGPIDEWTVITVDTSLSYTFTPVTYSDPQCTMPSLLRPEWLNDSIYIISCDIGFSGDKYYKGDIFVFEANANQNHQDLGTFVHFYRPDTTDQVAYNGPTFTEKDKIYVGSWRASNPGASYNGRYMVGMVDEDMNMKGMVSLGKDGYQYDMESMQATDDGGCILAGTVHDNANAPDYDYDLFIRKIMPDQIVSVAEQTEDPNDSDYFICPNPGNDKLNINTARKGVELKIVDLSGKTFYEKRLENIFLNTVDVNTLPPGIYLLHFKDNEGYEESIKWIKR